MIDLIKKISDIIYRLELRFFLPVILKLHTPKVRMSKDVLHVAPLTTKPRIICKAMRECGIDADYLGFTHIFSGSSWLYADDKRADYLVNSLIPLSCVGFFSEIIRFYRIILNYRVIHCHFLRFPSKSGWELPVLKKLGVKVVIHYRGCDLRSPVLYATGDFGYTACSECSYPASYCTNKAKSEALKLADEFGNLFLVTTPDLLDFKANALYFPFFMPVVDPASVPAKRATGRVFEVVHSTNHEDIDGTRYIIDAVEKLQREGFDVGLNIVKKIAYKEVFSYYKGADISVGKLMMGYYANFQIESIALGTPAACYIRDDLKKYCQNIDIIDVNPETLYEILKDLIINSDKLKVLAEKQLKGLRKLHNNVTLSKKLVDLYMIKGEQ